MTYADRAQDLFTYDVHGNTLTHTDANGTAVASTYDLLNRLTRRDIAPGAGVSADTTCETYAYDGLSRLVEAMDNDAEVDPAYDSLSDVVCREGKIGAKS